MVWAGGFIGFDIRQQFQHSFLSNCDLLDIWIAVIVKWGRELVFSTVNTDLICSFSTSAFSVADVAIFPSVLFRGQYQSFAVFFALINFQ